MAKRRRTPRAWSKTATRKACRWAERSRAGQGAPTFTVWAIKEADGANLDRIQIVKGWVDAKGEPQDKVFDVVWSGDRKRDAKGKVPAVGNTVDLKTADVHELDRQPPN